MNMGNCYWVHTDQGIRTCIPVVQGRKWTQCLVIEADGFHTAKLSGRERIDDTGMTPRKVRGWVRKIKPATKAAAKLRKEILA